MSSPDDSHDRTVSSVLWALGRMVTLRKQGESARFRVVWHDKPGIREYRLQIRRGDGRVETSPLTPDMDGPSVEESPVAGDTAPSAPAASSDRELLYHHVEALLEGQLRAVRTRSTLPRTLANALLGTAVLVLQKEGATLHETERRLREMWQP